MENQVIPGWDLITPVSAPLEAVVDSAHTVEEGGSTWRWSHAFSHRDVYRLKNGYAPEMN